MSTPHRPFLSNPGMLPEPLRTDSHLRQIPGYRYLYPVLSRRSGGLSLGINLNRDKRCNLACVYCEVDRSVAGDDGVVNLAELQAELSGCLDIFLSGTIFERPPFDRLSPDHRVLKDVSFAGDGEPTSFRNFSGSVRIVDSELRRAGLAGTKGILITNATYFHKRCMAEALSTLAECEFDVWAKLDAGTQTYMNLMSGTRFPMTRLINNIALAGKDRAITIQSLFASIHGLPPPAAEIEAYVSRLEDLLERGTRIAGVQVYTLARRPAEPWVTPLGKPELEAIGAKVEQVTGLEATVYS